MLEYLALGHVTRDHMPDGTLVPGGTVRYAAAVAAQLGLRTGVLTVGPLAALDLPPTVAVATTPSPTLTTFANRYDSYGRSQVLHALGAPVQFAVAPPAWRSTPLIHLAPVADEFSLDAALDWVDPTARICVTPQGWLRRWNSPLPAPVQPQLWLPAPALLRRLSLMVLSSEDVAGDEALVARYAAACPLVAFTRGAAGATLFVAGVPHRIAPFAVVERDPTGAGDVFAAALLSALLTTDDPLAAARFASAAAALAVTGPGLGELTGRTAVDRLLTSV